MSPAPGISTVRLLCSPDEGRRQGFAVVIALTLMSFVLLLILSLSTFVRVAHQQTENTKAMALAQNNAILGLQMAIGTLQFYAGPDQRITARSDIAGSDVPNPYWTGVWNSAKPDPDADDPETSLDPSSPLAWLISANREDPRAIHPLTEDLENTEMHPDYVWLLGPDNVNDRPGVRLPREPIPAGDGGNAGHFAWWVADEGVKAKLNIDDALAVADPREEDDVRANLGRFKNARRVGVPFLDPDLLGFINLGEPATRSKLGRLQLKEELPFLDASIDSNVIRALSPHFTLHSHGVLSDSINGGLRKDLTRGLDFQNFPGSPLLGQPIFEIEIQTGSLSGNLEEGPYWDVLASYFQHFRDVDRTDPTRPVSPVVPPRNLEGDAVFPEGESYTGLKDSDDAITTSAVHPVVSRAGLKAVLRLEPEGIPYTIANPYASDGTLEVQDYRPVVHLYPYFTLWNPTDITIEAQRYRLARDFFRRPEDQEIRFEVHTGRRYVLLGGGALNHPGRSYIDPWLEAITDSEGNEILPAGLDPLYQEAIQTYSQLRLEFETESVSFAPGEMLMFFLPLGEGGTYNPLSPSAQPIPLSTDPNRTINDFNDPFGPSLQLRFDTNLTRVSQREHKLRFLWRFSFNHPTNNFVSRWGNITNRKFEGEPYPFHRRHSNSSSVELLLPNGDPLQITPDLGPHIYASPWFVPRNDDRNGVARDGFNSTISNLSQALDGRGTFPTGPDQFQRGILRPHNANQGATFFANVNHRAGWNNQDRLSMIPNRPFGMSQGENPGGEWVAGPDGPIHFNPFSKWGSNDTLHWDTDVLRPEQAFLYDDGSTLPDKVLGYGLYWQRDVSHVYGPGQIQAPSVLPAFHVPSSPPQSIAELRHANLGFQGSTPSYAIGSSLLPFAAPGTNETGSSGGMRWNPLHLAITSRSGQPFLDLAYLLNQTLWDSYYFSTVPADGDEAHYPGFDGPFNEAYIQAGRPLPNHRMRYGTFGSQPELELDALRSYDQAARHLMVDGAFNINSTSVEAWRAQLASLSQQDIRYRDEIDRIETSLLAPDTPEGTLQTIFPRTPRLVGPIVDEVLSNLPNTRGRELAGGLRGLDENQLTVLAEEIVRVVREEGPFPGLSALINRPLLAVESGEPPHPGRLYNRSPLSRAIRHADIRLRNQSSPNPINHGSTFAMGRNPIAIFIPYHRILDYTGEEMPGWLSQGDLLGALAPVISARSDTFTVRSYGDVVNPVTGNTDARVWCEAVIQRIPETVANEDTGEENPFGRRFIIVSFRWLPEQAL